MTNYACTKGKECTTCQKQGIKASSDPDSSDQAWEYYKHAYVNVNNTPLNDYFSKICPDKRHNQSHDCLSFLTNSKIKRLKPLQKDGIPIMGADTMFNFNHKKYNIFKDIPDIDIMQLDRCAKNHHSLLNFSLMPQTGAMNNFKGINHKLDRFDYFISDLDNYYEADCFKRAETALGKYYLKETDCPARVRNNFLNEFNNVKDYCKQVYFIDENFKPNDGILKTNDKTFIESLIDNGKKAIDTKDNLIKYMDLAEDYWEMRHNQIQKNLCNSCKQGNCNCNSNKYYYTDRHGDSKSYCYHDNCKPEISI